MLFFMPVITQFCSSVLVLSLYSHILIRCRLSVYTILNIIFHNGTELRFIFMMEKGPLYLAIGEVCGGVGNLIFMLELEALIL